MENINNYIVYLDDVRENERIIFKLICSVSQRSKGRSNSYSLASHFSETSTDIVVGDIQNKDTHDSSVLNPRLYNAWLSDTSTDEQVNTIVRPLIATRVLTTLDHLVEQNHLDKNTENESTDNITETVQEEISNSKESQEDVFQEEISEDISIEEVTFDITEEEASELAIVQDEALSNPANVEESLIIQSLPASITQIGSVNTQKNIADNNLTDIRLPRALVVDDSPSVRKQLELELELFNVNVDYAESAEAAITFLKKEIYDIAFLDVVLPDKDGFYICKQVKAKSKDTIAIMLTGKSTQSDKIKGSLAGCDAYLVKPVGRATFQSAAKKYLELKEQPISVEA